MSQRLESSPTVIWRTLLVYHLHGAVVTGVDDHFCNLGLSAMAVLVALPGYVSRTARHTLLQLRVPPISTIRTTAGQHLGMGSVRAFGVLQSSRMYALHPTGIADRIASLDVCRGPRTRATPVTAPFYVHQVTLNHVRHTLLLIKRHFGRNGTGEHGFSV